MPIQLLLPFRPPVKPEPRGISAAMQLYRRRITDWIEVDAWQPPGASKLAALIRQMHYDDALICGAWRLEFLWLNAGYSHYRLYWYGGRRHVFGVADVRIEGTTADVSESRQLPFVRRYLAAYLYGLGWQAGQVRKVRGAPITPLDAPTAGEYRLFVVNLELEEKRAKERRKQEARAHQQRVRAVVERQQPAVYA